VSEGGPFGVRESRPGPPAPPPPAPAPPPRRSTVTWIVGVAVVFAIAYITLNTLRPAGTPREPGASVRRDRKSVV